MRFRPSPLAVVTSRWPARVPREIFSKPERPGLRVQRLTQWPSQRTSLHQDQDQSQDSPCTLEDFWKMSGFQVLYALERDFKTLVCWIYPGKSTHEEDPLAMPLLCTSWELGSSTKFHCAFCTAQDSTAPCHSLGGSRLAWPTLSHHCQVLPQPSPGHSPFHRPEGTFSWWQDPILSEKPTSHDGGIVKTCENGLKISIRNCRKQGFSWHVQAPPRSGSRNTYMEKVIPVESNMHLTSAASQPMAATRINHIRRSM